MRQATMIDGLGRMMLQGKCLSMNGERVVQYKDMRGSNDRRRRRRERDRRKGKPECGREPERRREKSGPSEPKGGGLKLARAWGTVSRSCDIEHPHIRAVLGTRQPHEHIPSAQKVQSDHSPALHPLRVLCTVASGMERNRHLVSVSLRRQHLILCHCHWDLQERVQSPEDIAYGDVDA